MKLFLKLTYLWFGLLLLSPALMATSATSTVSYKSFYSAQLERNWPYLLYLPAHYNAKKNYPVLILLHGMYATPAHWQNNQLQKILDEAISTRKMPETIVIAPEGGKYSWWIDSDVYGNLETAFLTDFLPYINDAYPINPKRRYHAIAGISMGGFGALRYAMLKPDYFNSVVLFSPAIYESITQAQTHERAVPMGALGKVVLFNTTTRGVFGKPFEEERWQELTYAKLYDDYISQKKLLKISMFYGINDDICDDAMQQFIDFMAQKNHKLAVTPLAGKHSWSVWRQAMGLAFTKHLFS